MDDIQLSRVDKATSYKELHINHIKAKDRIMIWTVKVILDNNQIINSGGKSLESAVDLLLRRIKHVS